MASTLNIELRAEIDELRAEVAKLKRGPGAGVFQHVTVIGDEDRPGSVTFTRPGMASIIDEQGANRLPTLTAGAGIGPMGSLEWLPHGQVGAVDETGRYAVLTPSVGAATSGLLYASTASATCANTTTETTLMGTGVGGPNVGTDLEVGDVIHVRAGGAAIGWASSTFRLRLRYGTGASDPVVADTGALSGGTFSGTNSWVADCIIVVRSLGASGSVVSSGWMLPTTVAATLNVNYPWQAAATTVDTTTAEQLNLTAQWGTASAANAITSDTVIVSRGL